MGSTWETTISLKWHLLVKKDFVSISAECLMALSVSSGGRLGERDLMMCLKRFVIFQKFLVLVLVESVDLRCE